MHPHSQWQRIEHLITTLACLHVPLQAFPHTRMHTRTHTHTHTRTHTHTVVKEAMQTLLALTSTVQNCVQIFCCLACTQTHAEASCVALLVSRYNLFWCRVHLACWSRTSYLWSGGKVCGRASEHPCVKSWRLASFILHPWAAIALAVQDNSPAFKVSYMGWVKIRSPRSLEIASRVSVRSGSACHASQTVSLPMPRKDNDVSHTLKKWTGEAWVISQDQSLGDCKNCDVLKVFSSFQSLSTFASQGCQSGQQQWWQYGVQSWLSMRELVMAGMK